MSSNIFEVATRKKYRYNTGSGNINTEDLWDLSMNMLDKLYKSLKAELNKINNSDSLFDNIDAESKAKVEELTNKVKIIAVIFEVKKYEYKTNAEMLEKIQLAKRIDDIIQKKKDSRLEDLSIEQLERIRDGESVESVIEEDKKVEVSNSVVEEEKDN